MSLDADLATLREGLGIRPTDSSSPQRRRKREQHEALDRMETELARLRKERDALEELQPFPVSTVMSWKNRSDVAEREVARLREGLRQIAESETSQGWELYDDPVVGSWVVDTARALLADTEDGAA